MVIPVEEGNRGIFFEPGSTITKFWGKLFPIILGVILNLFHVFSKKMNCKNSWTISVCRILILRQTRFTSWDISLLYSERRRI